MLSDKEHESFMRHQRQLLEMVEHLENGRHVEEMISRLVLANKEAERMIVRLEIDAFLDSMGVRHT